MPAAPEHIEQFLDALWMERGLSDNTLSAYRNDLTQFALWLQQHQQPNLLGVERNQLMEYLALRSELAQRKVLPASAY